MLGDFIILGENCRVIARISKHIFYRESNNVAAPLASLAPLDRPEKNVDFYRDVIHQYREFVAYIKLHNVINLVFLPLRLSTGGIDFCREKRKGDARHKSRYFLFLRVTFPICLRDDASRVSKYVTL